ncbi:hypothetical protein CNECB9_2610050 [Cupriavidus necator]|uniref:Uncharacterized protein n=1 Tax=Cupriavidus necator TaxID=106590 RepID=A0A1K0JLC0_CUPNE|nr:hypothetical protein CNECB9_2610050 [Cupriavidus necator]
MPPSQWGVAGGWEHCGTKIVQTNGTSTVEIVIQFNIR